MNQKGEARSYLPAILENSFNVSEKIGCINVLNERVPPGRLHTRGMSGGPTVAIYTTLQASLISLNRRKYNANTNYKNSHLSD